MIPADLRHVVVVEELDLSVDGRLAIVVRRTIQRDRYHGHLFAIDLDGSTVPRPRQLTRGTVRDTKPRLSPDGHTLAFVRSDPADDDAPARIMVLDIRRPGRVAKAQDRPPRRHRGVGLVAGWTPPGLHGRGRPAAVPPGHGPGGRSSAAQGRARRAVAPRLAG